MNNDLARRAVACRHWRWLPGMRWGHESHGGWWSSGRHIEGDAAVASAALPDLDDPATLGCLLALVREAWGDPLICTAVDNTGCGWWLDGWADSRVPGKLHPTEAEALVAALEAAP